MNSLILKSIDHERLFEEDTVPVSQTKSLWQNLENAILSSRFAAFDNRRRLLRLHCLDIAMIKFLDESESIKNSYVSRKLFHFRKKETKSMVFRGEADSIPPEYCN